VEHHDSAGVLKADEHMHNGDSHEAGEGAAAAAATAAAAAEPGVSHGDASEALQRLAALMPGVDVAHAGQAAEVDVGGGAAGAPPLFQGGHTDGQ